MRTSPFPMLRGSRTSRPAACPGSPRAGTALLPPGVPMTPATLAAMLSLTICLALGASPALAQVTNTSDEDPPLDNSLRAEIEASAPSSTVDVQLGEADSEESVIALGSTLTFDNSVIIDNSDTMFGPMTIRSPNVGSLFEIEDGVRVILRDVGLANNGQNNLDEINLQTATSTLTFNLGRGDQTVTSDIVGLGSVAKDGTSTLTLSGFNSFAGGLTIRQGDVVGDGVALDTSFIDLAASGATTARVVLDTRTTDFLNSTSPMIRNLSTGGGAAFFVKRGTGTLDLSDPTSMGIVMIDNTIGMVVEEGDLVIGDDFLAGNHNYQIDPDGTLSLRLSNFTPAFFSGSLAGSGQVHTEALSLGLTGNLTPFTGLLDISVSTVGASTVEIAPSVAPAGPLSFNVQLNGPTTGLVLDDAFGFTFAGNISGTGALIKTGTGTTELTGVATHTLRTNVSAGSLIGNVNNLQRDIFVSNGSTLGFRQQSNGVFNGTINSNAGSINVRKLGSGQLTLASDQPFVGDLNVDAGGLHFAQGANLTNANLVVGAGVGASIASLTTNFNPNLPAAGNTVDIGGDLTFTSNALLRVDVDDASGTSTAFAAGGAVTIDPAAILTVFLQPGVYAGSPTFDILTGSSVSGDFRIQQDVYFFDLVGASNGNAYQLTLDPSGNTMAGAATTRNQFAVGRQLDIFRTGPSGGDPEIERVQNTLTISRASEITDILDAVSPDDLAIPIHTELAAAARTWRSLSNRLGLQRNQSIGHHNTREGRRQKARRERAERLQRRGRRRPAPSVDAGPSSELPMPQEKPWVAWLEGDGAIGELDSNQAKGFDYKIVGPLIGADTALTGNLRAGFAAGMTHARYEATGNQDSKGDTNSAEALVYGMWIGKPVEVLVGARYAHSWVESKRRGKFQTGSGRIDSEHEGDIFGFYAELTRGFMLPYQVEVSPLASVAYTHLTWEDFDESGTSALRMRVEEKDVDSTMTSLGLRIVTEREMDDGFLFRPRFKALWNHEWGDTEREVTGSFVSAPVTGGGPFTVVGPEMPDDHAEISAGWEIGYNANANVFIDWDGRFGEDLIENSLSVGVRVAW
jgi:outer membrane autotransporter protein